MLPDAFSLIERGCVPGGTNRNRKAVERAVTWSGEVDEPRKTILCDAQTSGGLLAAVPADEAGPLRDALAEAGYASAIVGAFGPEVEAAPFIQVDR